MLSQGFISLHPVLLQIVPSGLWSSAQINAFAVRGKAPPCKSIERSKTESYKNSENRERRFLISEMDKTRLKIATPNQIS
jgi:hypothetical protein